MGEYDDLSYVIRSVYRIGVIGALREVEPQTPSEIADEDMRIAHVSRALGELLEEGLVELMVDEDVKKGRLYGMTERGEGVAEMLADRGDLA